MNTFRRILLTLAVVIACTSPNAWAIPPAPPASAFSGITITGSTITTSTLAVSDYQYIPIDAGNQYGGLPQPSAAQIYQGTVGSTIPPTPANVTYTTFTISGANITSAVWGSATQTGTLTIASLTVGKTYRLNFTPTITSQVPTLTATNGTDLYVIPTLVTTVQEVVYFRATATSAVFTFSNTAASSWSTASTTCYEYAKPEVGREYSNSVLQTLLFKWIPPADWNAGTITIVPDLFISETAPSNTNTAIWSYAGYCIATGSTQSQAVGTAQTSTYTAGNGVVIYTKVIPAATAAITLPGAAASTVCYIAQDRAVSGSYAQPMASTGFWIHFGRTLAP